MRYAAEDCPVNRMKDRDAGAWDAQTLCGLFQCPGCGLTLEPGQVGDRQPRGAGAPHGEGPYVAELVDHDERAGGRGGEQRV